MFPVQDSAESLLQTNSRGARKVTEIKKKDEKSFYGSAPDAFNMEIIWNSVIAFGRNL